MNKFLYILLTLTFFSLLQSCADKNTKLKVSGANVQTSESEQTTSSEISSEEGQVTVSDESISERTEPEIDPILKEELLEVGDRVYFDYDKSKFKNEGVETLKRQARFLNVNTELTITIEGHCDPRGTREYNLALGERRAYSVKNFLASLGVSENRISVISYGKEKPQSDGNNERSWAQSRTAITVINP